MNQSIRSSNHRGMVAARNLAVLATGLAGGFLVSLVLANSPPPSEHKAIEVESLGAIPSSSISKQLSLQGHKLQLREITIMPGGQIAKHSHESRPGIVKVMNGTWTEGRPAGEIEYSAGDEVILEDSNTIHWFFNRGESPATAYVCDIVPES